MPARSPQHQALGAALRSARKEAGHAQRSLAARAGIDRGHYGAIERGQADPTYEILLSLANALGTSLSELFARAGL